MIVIHVMGGLGNQLYQFALYEKFKALGKEVKIDTFVYRNEAGEEKEWRPFELDRFPKVSFEEATEEDRERLLDNNLSLFCKIKRKLLGRKNKTYRETRDYMPEIFELDDVYLYGFWNCEKYYEDMVPLLQQKLQFPESKNPMQISCMERIKTENAVSIHIRRTDYLLTADGKRYMGICTDEYYDKAISYIKERVENPVFYLFSDDIEYCREKYKSENMHIVDWNHGEDSLFDMQLMSLCKHNICANSTFSMWGARLNTNAHKIVIRPLHHDNYETTPVEKIQEYWKRWILIDEKGKVLS